MKTGTSSVSNFLKFFMNEGYKTGGTIHLTLKQCHEKIAAKAENPSEYKSFSFVRNPWSHMYSMYKYSNRTGNYDGSWDDWMFDVKYAYESMDFYRHHKFNGFLDRLQSPYKDIDYVGRLETLSEDFEEIKKLFLNHHPLYARIRSQTLEHLNVSSSNKKEYINQYNPEQYETVKYIYERDIKFFKFTFEQ